MPDSLLFEVATDHPRYGPSERIGLRFRLTNIGQVPVIVNARFGLNRPQRVGEVWLDLVGPVGVPRFSASVNLGTPRPVDFTTLAPGEVVEKEIALRTYYQLDEPGAYTLRGTYHNKWSGEVITGRAAWTGQVESATTTFSIVAGGTS